MARGVAKPPVPQAVGGRRRTRVDGPHVQVSRFVRLLVHEVRSDGIADLGAMLAYYAILALFPMLVFIVTLAMLVLDPATIEQGVAMATEAMPRGASEVIAARVRSFVDSAGAGFAVGSAAFALWSASRGMSALSGALNAMYDKQETRSWWWRQVVAIGVTFAVAILVVLALALLVIGPVAGHWLTDRFGLGHAFDVVWGGARWIGAGVLVMVVWAMLYQLLPNTRAPFRVFTPGAIVGVVLWLAISYGFGIYLDHFGRYEAIYGALGGGIIFLTWLWLSNVALLLGAEINDVLAELRKDSSAAARQLADEDETR